MTIGSLGLRSSGSYGSLQQQQIHSGLLSLPVQTTPPRKSPKMIKEKEILLQWIYKFAPRKKIGMLLLCFASIAVFLWVLVVGKGEVPRESFIRKIDILSGPIAEDKVDLGGTPSTHITEEDGSTNATLANLSGTPPTHVTEVDGSTNATLADLSGTLSTHVTEVKGSINTTLLPPPPPPPPPSIFFTGYKLPPGNPCEHFTLPPPPADKKRTGPRPCPVCYLPVEDAVALMPNAPSFSPVLKDLSYIHEENLTKSEFGGSEFGGYPSLSQRSDSYDIRESMSVHCGFVRGVKPGHQTGFDIDDFELLQMETCRGVVVASAIFGAFDLIRQPKNISEYAKKNVCFHMFVDEETKAFLRTSGEFGSDMKVGLWRIIIVRNLPYSDPRRNGKVPKLLLHRLFPNARYSLWIDAKLELVVDPFQILERFLWRKNASFAISRHYRRFDVFVEAEANKAAAKYDNASIDFQVDFYKKEGLTPYSSKKLPITSDVPEGCVIIKEHVPLANLFTCLWFNEVDRFTSRDQISFSTVRDKIWSKTDYAINMFLDCERRNFVIQGYHRDLLENWAPPPPPNDIALIQPTPPNDIALVQRSPPIIKQNLNYTSLKLLPDSIISSPIKKVPVKRGKDRSSRRHRKIITGSNDRSAS